MSNEKTAVRIDELLAHVWMVRTFLKHCEEAEDDDELREVFRELYDYMHAVGPAFERQEWDQYLKLAKKKIRKLTAATALFLEIQPDISSHTNFKMAARSLKISVDEIVRLIDAPASAEVES